MDDQECNKAYKRLIDILNQNKLNWITAQVEEEVHLGRTAEKEIETLKESSKKFDLFNVDEYPSLLKKGPKARFPITVDYKPCECLELLLDAIEQVIINTAYMARYFMDFFGGELNNWSGVRFQSEEEDSIPILIDKGQQFLNWIMQNELMNCLMLCENR